jgi:hypothetical protein
LVPTRSSLVQSAGGRRATYGPTAWALLTVTRSPDVDSTSPCERDVNAPNGRAHGSKHAISHRGSADPAPNESRCSSMKPPMQRTALAIDKLRQHGDA